MVFFFFFIFAIGKDTLITIVTNKYVIENCKTGVLKFNSDSLGLPDYGDILSLEIPNFENLWIKHPSEDLAILPVGPVLRKLVTKYKKFPHFRTFGDDMILKKESADSLRAIEDVLMIGYPKGFSDTVNNYPIIRKGITATPIYLNYNGKNQFLLDIPIYPGSSGSPITYKSGGGFTKNGGFEIVANPKIYLLGIAVEAQDYAAKGKTIEKVGTRELNTVTWLPFGIAVIIKSYVLLDFKPLLKKAMTDRAYNEKLIKAFN